MRRLLNIRLISRLSVLVAAICIFTILLPYIQGIVVKADDSDKVSSRFFRIKVVDSQSGRGVPLVELKTNNNIIYVTDSAG